MPKKKDIREVGSPEWMKSTQMGGRKDKKKMRGTGRNWRRNQEIFFRKTAGVKENKPDRKHFRGMGSTYSKWAEAKRLKEPDWRKSDDEVDEKPKPKKKGWKAYLRKVFHW